MRRAGIGAVGSGLVAGVVAAALAGLTVLGPAALGAGVFAVQIVIALAWLAALDARGSLGAFAIAVAAAGVTDVVVAWTGEPDIGRAAPVLGIAFVVSLLHQLWRRPRPGVAISLAATVSAVALALCGASYLALRLEGGGDKATVAALLGAGAALAAARLVDVGIAQPTLASGSRRGVPGLLIGAGVACIVGATYGAHTSLGTDHGLRLAVIAALLALVADLAVDAVLGAAPPADERPRSALTPLGALLPVVLSGPAAYVAGRILLG